MNEAKGLKIAVSVAVLTLVALAVFRLTRPLSETSPDLPPAIPSPVTQTDSATRQHAPRPSPEDSDPDAAEADKPKPLISREQAEAFLFKHDRSATSLLAAYRALQDTNLLMEATAKFPGDPQVQLALLNSDVLGPDEKRHWLEAFKTSNPDNSLANYLSAAAYFGAGNQEAAIQDLLAAAGKTQFKDFTLDGILDQQELLSFAGNDAKALMTESQWATDLMRMLVQMKQVGNGIVTAQSQYAQAGDAASVENLLQMGFGLAERFDSRDGGRFVINQLVGSAIESLMLQKLDATTAYESLGGKTPQARQAELKQQKAELRELLEALQPAQATLTGEEWANYFDRVKTYGELEALRWLKQRTAAANSR